MLARERREPERQLAPDRPRAGSCRRHRGSAARRGAGRAAPRPRRRECAGRVSGQRVQAFTSRAASCRQASTRKAPEPMAGSHTLSASTSSGLASGPSRSKAGSSAWSHDRLGQIARRVVAAGAPALVGRLQERRAGRGERGAGRGALVDARFQRRFETPPATSPPRRAFADLVRQLDLRCLVLQDTSARSRTLRLRQARSRSTKTGILLFLPAADARAPARSSSRR